MSERIVDADAILWLVKNGGEVTKETIIALCEKVKSNETTMKELRFNGCGNTECGMAVSGFSWRPSDEEETYWKIGDPDPEES